ncbi:MAG: protein BatD, partial [Bacteroidia bacterium]|nr:protein BatD [Bacteroidia bacterium]
VNGQMSQSISLSYLLVPKKEGKYVIGPASIMSGGHKLETAPITIEVGKGGSAAQGTNQSSGKVQGGGDDIFIRTSLSKSKCYLGEQVVITQKLYSRYQFLGFQKGNMPVYDGFWSQNLEQTGVIKQLPNEVVDGIQYYVYQLFLHQAAPTKTGKIAIAPLEEEVVVRRASSSKPRNIFEQFFGPGYEDVAIKVKGNTAVVDVMELPLEGKPLNFNGAVGSYNYKAEVNKNSLKANDAFNLKISISGKGNTKLIDAPVLNLPESFESYDPKTTETSNGKIFDYLIIPRQEGDYKLDNLGFSYFNLETKKYVTIPSPEISIQVLPPDPNSAGAQVFTPKNQVKETENDIRYIKKGSFNLSKSETEFFNSGLHLLLLSLPFFLLTFALLARKNYLKNNSDVVAVKQRKAVKIAKKQLVSAEKFMTQNNKDAFYTEILMAINNYVSSKLNIPPAEISKEIVEKNLVLKNVEAEFIKKLVKTIEVSEFAKYAPGAVSGDLKAVYNDTVNLITEIEQQINTKKA